MKKLFPGILAMVMCFGMLAACGDDNKPSSSPDSSPADSSSSSSVTPMDPHEATLNDVKSYVHGQLIQKNYETRKDFTLMNSFFFTGEDAKYDISWSVDVEEGVTIVEGETEDTVVIGELSEDLPFILTGTITDPEGCHSVQFTLEGLALKALSEVPTAITEAPVEGEAYKYHVYQSTLAKDMYFVGDMDGYYFKTTEVAAEAVDVFVEYKAGSTTEFYPWFNHAENGKQYIGVRLSDDGGHDNIVYTSEPVSVFVWNAELGTITTHLDKNKEGKAADYYLGNYSTFNTISASTISHAGGAGNNVGHLVKMVDKNSITPDKKVAEEKEKLSVVSEVIGEKSIELIAKGNTYSDVAIAWEVSGNNAVIENGVLKLSVPATADETVTLTATITCGDVTDTKVFSILLKKYELPAADSEISIPKALEIGETLKGDTEAKYYISGTVTSVENTKYGNLYIEDANGNSIYVYGVYSADGTTRYDAMENAPQVGDTVKLYSIVSYYKAAQLKNAWVVEWTPGEEQPPVDSSSSNTDVPPADDSSSSNTDVPPADDSSSSNTDTPSSSEDSTTPSNPTTPAEIVNALYALADNESMTGPFTVTGVITALDTYNNPTIVVENMTDKPVYCYKLKDGRFVVGATITVTAGSMKNYQGTYEFMDCTLDSIELPSDVPPADDNVGALTAVVPNVGTPYIFGMTQGNLDNAIYYLAGGMDSYYMATTTNADNAIQTYIEATDGGYYFYTYVNNVKTYINMVVNGTHVNGAYETTASTVYTIDEAHHTLIAVVNGEQYWFATRNDNTYTTMGPAKVSYAGFYGEFYATDDTTLPPEDSSSSEELPPVDSSSTPDDGGETPDVNDPTENTLPSNLSFASAVNKESADTYMANNYSNWTITGKLGQTYGGYLGFGRSGDKVSSITSSSISVSSAFTVNVVLKGNGSNGVATSTLTFTLIDADGVVIATGYVDGVSAICPPDGKDTTYSISFTFVDGKTWADVSNLKIDFAKATGNIGLKSLNFVTA